MSSVIMRTVENDQYRITLELEHTGQGNGWWVKRQDKSRNLTPQIFGTSNGEMFKQLGSALRKYEEICRGAMVTPKGDA